jgi:hypothetical protein
MILFIPDGESFLSRLFYELKLIGLRGAALSAGQLALPCPGAEKAPLLHRIDGLEMGAFRNFFGFFISIQTGLKRQLRFVLLSNSLI